MTHADLINALFPDGPPADYKAHALLLDASAVQAMQAAQDAVGSERHKVQPVATTDGRWLVSADILGELAPGGIFAPAMEYFDGSKLGGVEVVPWADGVALLPVPEMDEGGWALNINTADAETLAERLPGVGASLAQSIIDGRPWADPADLAQIGGISAAMVEGWMDDPGVEV